MPNVTAKTRSQVARVALENDEGGKSSRLGSAAFTCIQSKFVRRAQIITSIQDMCCGNPLTQANRSGCDAACLQLAGVVKGDKNE